ncbi:MAG: Gfo/Idh/MocA family oxidoreductase [Sedimentisphaerales bacterium]|nr:Gfo/Idh/MocA family oxidoreductase [Sedimentisphaerales bacterium]
MSHNVAIIGAGLIGTKRAVALGAFGDCRLKMVVDINQTAAEELAGRFGAEAATNWRKAVESPDVDLVVASTCNNVLAPISIAALKNKKHVLCEKPLGRNVGESRSILENAQNGIVLKTGFNHRHHPAISKAKQLADKGEIGRIMFLRCRYGHGGRPGYEKEWRADKDLCGGGELLDQGVHVVDLFRWFAGDFHEAFGYTQTSFWDMRVEDNAFVMFKSKAGVVATMHTSWTQWKNLFSLEVFGDLGYLLIEGLGGSYGIETLKFGRRNPKGGPPEEQIEQFPGPDFSWRLEWEEFTLAIREKREPLGSGNDGWQANRMIEAVQESVRLKRVVEI